MSASEQDGTDDKALSRLQLGSFDRLVARLTWPSLALEGSPDSR